MLDRWSLEELTAAFTAAPPFRPIPPPADTGAWTAVCAGELGSRRRQTIGGAVAAILARPLPGLPQALAGRYASHGDRLAFETPYFERRHRLAWLAMGLLTDTGGPGLVLRREFDATLEALLDEPAWTVPAHAAMRGDPAASWPPDPRRPVVDLFAADTAAQLAEALALLDAPDRLRQRIISEVEARVVLPVLDYDFWWLHGENNWTPWCCAMVFLAAAHLLTDPHRLARLTRRLLAAAEHYLAAQPSDGGCEEGPQYWAVSPPMLFLFLETLRERSAGRCDLTGDARLAALADYLPRLHLGGGVFPWFADCRPVVCPRLGLCRRYAQASGSRRLATFVSEAVRGFVTGAPPTRVLSDLQSAARSAAPLVHLLRDLCWLASEDPVDAEPPPDEDVLPISQILVLRGGGFAIAIKGGCTAASHGHLDIGQVVISHGGRPLVVDAGIGAYRAAVFGPQRWQQPWIRAEDHAVPTINGITQVLGSDRRARLLAQRRDGQRSLVRLDLRDAYPADVPLTTVQRTLELDRTAGRVRLTDHLATAPGPIRVVLPLILAIEPTELEPGRCRLGPILLSWDPAVLSATSGSTPLDDPFLEQAWGPVLYRLTLTGSADGELVYELCWSASLAR